MEHFQNETFSKYEEKYMAKILGGLYFLTYFHFKHIYLLFYMIKDSQILCTVFFGCEEKVSIIGWEKKSF